MLDGTYCSLATGSETARTHSRLRGEMKYRAKQVLGIIEGFWREDIVDGRFEEDEVDVGAAVERKVSVRASGSRLSDLHVSRVAPVKVVRIHCRPSSIDELHVLSELSPKRLVKIRSDESPPRVRDGAIL